jgi:hypothetical protein
LVGYCQYEEGTACHWRRPLMAWHRAVVAEVNNAPNAIDIPWEEMPRVSG